MTTFRDLLHGELELPDWMLPFLKLPEFLRLRGVRLSNVDSFEFKDFNAPTRWEHGVAVASLALRCARRRGLDDKRTAELALAGLLHDVATPPFAHTAEHVLQDFDHERETQHLLSSSFQGDTTPDAPIFASQLPQFEKTLRAASRKLKLRLDPIEIAKMVAGDGDLGFLVCGTLDLDNADNVTRAALHLGFEIDRSVPARLADWLATQPHIPTDLESLTEPSVQEWLGYREEVYRSFYNASDTELSREAFLQHLMRLALRSGLTRSMLLRHTDESLLLAIEGLNGTGASGSPDLSKLVQSYRLMEEPQKIAQISLDAEEVRVLSSPQAIAWLEQQFLESGTEIMPMAVLHKYGRQRMEDGLFGAPPGVLLIFKLGDNPKPGSLPDWMSSEFSERVRGRALLKAMGRVLETSKKRWVRERPWLDFTWERKETVGENLNSVTDWSFRLSRNEALHPYPSTFVHAIPANLIQCLGVRGELVLDPFGGTGQTAAEVVKRGGQAITADSNSIATLASRARFTYLPTSSRKNLWSISSRDVLGQKPEPAPDFDRRDQWFHPETLRELCRVWAFISARRHSVEHAFLTTCFSAILTECTGRRGKQHAYFADNTPLAKEEKAPPYFSAVEQFCARVRRNLDITERFYGSLERDSKDPKIELSRTRVLQQDATKATAESYGIEEKSVAAVITSPPYLCVSDYSLGLRLSYPWVAPGLLEADFGREIAARRRRSSPDEAVQNYYRGLDALLGNLQTIIRSGGFLAVVLGVPQAKAFKQLDVLGEFDKMAQANGMDLIWHQWRKIHWHRQGYQRLLKERLAVYSVS